MVTMVALPPLPPCVPLLDSRARHSIDLGALGPHTAMLI
jgi:hypothetical protein